MTMKDSIKISPKYGLNPTIPVCFFLNALIADLVAEISI